MKIGNSYWGKKVLWYFITLIIAVFLNFLLPRLIPGNPVATIVASMTAGMTDANAQKKVYDAYMAMFGLDKPIWQQFVIYIGNLFKGNMGISFYNFPREVSDIIAAAIPWTLMLQIPAILVGWFFGNALGAITAYRKGIFDRVFFPFFLFLSAIPAFGLAIVNVHFLANKAHLFPGGLGYAFDMLPNWGNPVFLLSVLDHYRLPFLTMVLVVIGGQALGMREMSIYELNADYVKYSRLMGIKDSKIVSYVFRNAMLPQITGLALSLGTMIGGNLITEIVFSYPGLGTTMFSAIRTQDFPLISGCTLIITVTVLAANFLVDIICGIIDPRVRAANEEG
ncbi:peptide ABC transporter permease [Spirochaetia bacterium]|nr:peptide ABC transporter permease [Spirochaetia bacterium]GHU34271.1 peptide ABC transporter permease [Spirochaetia bacterium]